MDEIMCDLYTHKAISDIFSPKNDHQHIYKKIQSLIGGNTHVAKVTTGLGFFSRILGIFQGKCSKQLPLDLVPEIVSRLSAEDVLNCIMVCKGWMDVTLTPHFFYLRQSRARPVILLKNYDQTADLKLYSLDLSGEKPYIRRVDTTKLSDCHDYLVGTFDGLLVLKTHCVRSSRFSICNPMTGRIITMVTVEGIDFCGFWFHPLKKEYCFLAASPFKRGDRRYCYEIYNLKGESTVVGWYDVVPILFEAPININCSLYYMLPRPMGHHLQNCIMIFDTETEKFDFKPHPHYDHCHSGHGRNQIMRLLEIEGSLAFAHVCSKKKSLYLWILVDRTTWHWIERYRIDLNWPGTHLETALYLLGVHKEEMVIFFKPNKLITFNLETIRVRKIYHNIIYSMSGSAVLSTTYRRSSLVGLKCLAHI